MQQEDLTFVGLNLPTGHEKKLSDLSLQQNYSLPPDIKIETFSLNQKPLSYDISYYPNSDSVILWGTDLAGLPCAWHRENVVNFTAGNSDKEVLTWRETVLGTKEHPTLNWENFLFDYYKTHNPPPVSEDVLIKKFHKLQ